MAYARGKKAIPTPVRRYLRPLRRLIARPGLTLSRMPLLGEFIAAVAPAQRPPILIVSLPRCGSTWVGKIFGSSKSVLYLHEPINQSYLSRFEGAPSVFEPAMCKDLRLYDRSASRAFNGIPRFGEVIVRAPDQWTLSDRKRKSVVIKEVNPLAIERWWTAFQPRIIFLVRHPVAVGRSLQALGWMQSGWQQRGEWQAEVQNRAMKFLRQVDHAVVRYEDLCEDPIGEFEKIFDYCQLEMSPAVRQEIERSSSTESDYVPGRYDTVRDSRRMRERWRDEVDPIDIASVRRGYLAKQPSFYTNASDW